jgi:hypothetical protein
MALMRCWRLTRFSPANSPLTMIGGEMMAVAFDGKMLAGQAGGDPGFDLFGVQHVTPQFRSL